MIIISIREGSFWLGRAQGDVGGGFAADYLQRLFMGL